MTHSTSLHILCAAAVMLADASAALATTHTAAPYADILLADDGNRHDEPAPSTSL